MDSGWHKKLITGQSAESKRLWGLNHRQDVSTTPLPPCSKNITEERAESLEWSGVREKQSSGLLYSRVYRNHSCLHKTYTRSNKATFQEETSQPQPPALAEEPLAADSFQGRKNWFALGLWPFLDCPDSSGWPHTCVDVCRVHWTQWDIHMTWNWGGDPGEVGGGKYDWNSLHACMKLSKIEYFRKYLFQLLFNSNFQHGGRCSADTQGGQRYWLPWGWSFRWLWVARCGCWELNSVKTFIFWHWKEAQYIIEHTALAKDRVHKNVCCFVASVRILSVLFQGLSGP